MNIVLDGFDGFNSINVFENLGTKTHNSIIATDNVFIGIQESLNMHNQFTVTSILRQTNIKTTTQIILLKIKIVFDLKIYNRILNIYWFMNRPFDPGGMVSAKQACGFICLTCTVGGGVRICHLYMLYRWTILLLVLLLFFFSILFVLVSVVVVVVTMFIIV